VYVRVVGLLLGLVGHIREALFIGAERGQDMSLSKKVKIVQEDTDEKKALQAVGIKCIDTRAIRRMISWALDNCDRQSVILDTALNILTKEIQKDRKKKGTVKKSKP
jgi:hypothetical protein